MILDATRTILQFDYILLTCLELKYYPLFIEDDVTKLE